MKKILALTLCFGLALPLIADAKPTDKEEKERRKAAKRAEKIEQMIEKREEQQTRGEEREQRRPEQQVREEIREPRQADNIDTRVREQVAPQVRRGPDIEQQQIAAETAVAPQINTEVRRQEYRERSRERRGPRAHAWSYDEAQRYQRRDRQDRDWWRSRYTRFALFGGGYYYWDRGYWYPAYGYDTRYNTYAYDEPIYGYNYMEPRQVMLRVQRELRREGYYRGALDGLIGPMTRAALARFQRDAGLRVTRRIDGPTLAALGVV
jgi:hypothetical protein